jgi:phenylalanine-4-hydroxylase
MAHDLFGHIPMLISMEHQQFLRRLARSIAVAKANRWDADLYEANRALAGLRCQGGGSAGELRAAEERVAMAQECLKKDPSPLTELSRMYLWSIEFGLMGEPSDFQIYGAGLLSSATELELVCAGRPVLIPYSIDVVDHDICFSDPQARYFVARNYTDLHDVLTRYEESRSC